MTYSHTTLCLLYRAIKANPKAATDLGCGTGLSMYMLDSKWPSIEKVTGIDLSTFKLAVCQEKKSMMVSESYSAIPYRELYCSSVLSRYVQCCPDTL